MLTRIKHAFVKDTEFIKRLKRRHYAFWKDPARQELDHPILDSSYPLKIWKEGENWQRRLSNKFNAKEFAKKYNCKVVDLYWKVRNVREIDFESLPPHYVIKPTIGHGSRQMWLMSNGVNLFDNRAWRKDEILDAMESITVENQKLEFLIEEFVRTPEGRYEIPLDYKFFMFNGSVACIEVIERKSPGKGTKVFYDEDWNELKTINYSSLKSGQGRPRPGCFEEMLEKAKELSRLYEIFVRIDFYASDKGAIFGEITPTPSLGALYSAYGSDLLVSYWDRYCAGRI